MHEIKNKNLIETYSDTTTRAAEIAKKIWDTIPEGEKNTFLEKAFDYLTGEGALEVWDLIKEGLEDRALTEEDKDTLVRKINIDKELLEGIDTVLTAISLILSVTPVALGVIWDVFQLGPIDEAVAAIPGIGWLLAIIAGVLSYLPEGIALSLLASVGIKIKLGMLRWLKNILIYKVIPEPEEIQEFEAVISEGIKHTSSNFAEEFKEYTNLWDASLEEAAEPDSVDKILWNIPDIEFSYDGFSEDRYEDHFDPGLWNGHYQTSETVHFPDYTYTKDAVSVFEALRDEIIPKYKDKVSNNKLLDEYLALVQAWEDSTDETESETSDAMDLFLATHLIDFVSMFEDKLINYYADSAEEYALDNITPQSDKEYWYDNY